MRELHCLILEIGQITLPFQVLNTCKFLSFIIFKISALKWFFQKLSKGRNDSKYFRLSLFFVILSRIDSKHSIQDRIDNATLANVSFFRLNNVLWDSINEKMETYREIWSDGHFLSNQDRYLKLNLQCHPADDLDPWRSKDQIKEFFWNEMTADGMSQFVTVAVQLQTKL